MFADIYVDNYPSVSIKLQIILYNYKQNQFSTLPDKLRLPESFSSFHDNANCPGFYANFENEC